MTAPLALQPLTPTLAAAIVAPPPRPVVLLRQPFSAHGHARARALELAAALQTRVVELRVLEEARARSRGLSWARVARARWERRFGEHHALPRLVTLPHLGARALAASLRQLGAQALVLGSVRVWPGDSVVRVAAESSVPCLVARDPRATRGLIAASRLLDLTLPVVRAAAAWAEVLHRPLTVHHHLEPTIDHAPRPALLPLAERVAAATGAEVAVTRGVDPVEGILATARASDADVIVVGAPAAPSDASRRVAPRVTALAHRSVLLVPLAA